MRPALARSLARLLGVVLLALSSVVWIAATAGPASAAPSDEFISRINAHRGANGLPALAVDGQLMATAQAWAQTMADSNTLRHRSDLWAGTPGAATSVGENVGYGGDVASVFTALVNSSGHNANMLDGGYTHVGVGVAHSADGILYTAHIFVGIPASSPPVTAPAAPAPPPPPPPPPTTVPPTTVPPPAPEPTTTTVAPAPVPETTTTVPAATTTSEAPRAEPRTDGEDAAALAVDRPGTNSGPPALVSGLIALGVAGIGIGGGMRVAQVRGLRPVRVRRRR